MSIKPLVYFVGAGPGDPELLTLKALRLLNIAEVCIYAGSLVPAEILNKLPKRCKRHDSSRLTLEQTTQIIHHASKNGELLIRLHSGEPALYGAIGEQMRELDKLGIGYSQVPGISSFQAAAATLCVELTCPEISQTVVLTRAPGRTPLPGEKYWRNIFDPSATYCLFLSVDKLEQIIPDISLSMGSNCPCAVVYNVSRKSQIVLRGTLSNIIQQVQNAEIYNTAQILIGYCLQSGIPTYSRLYASDFSHQFRKANF